MTSDYLEIKLQKYNLMYIKWKLVIHYWPLLTSNDLLWPLMTSKLKILKLQLYVYQMNLGNFLDMEYIFDLLVTSNWKFPNYNFMYITWKLVTQAI